MDMTTKNQALTATLTLVPSNDDEAKVLQDFADPNSPLAVEIKQSPADKWPHLEITKYL